MTRWTTEEENYVLKHVNKYGLENLPLPTMTKYLNRSVSSVTKKAKRLLEAKNYEWEKEESQEAFNLYLEGKSTGSILDELHEQGSTASMKELETELRRLKEAWTKYIRNYAEARQLPAADYLSLETIKFFIENYKTESDFIRKGLHTRIRNG